MKLYRFAALAVLPFTFCALNLNAVSQTNTQDLNDAHKQAKADEKADKSQTKADKDERKALKSHKVKKAAKQQDKADAQADKVPPSQ